MESAVQKMAPSTTRRRLIQWFLAPIVLVIIALGWKFPLLGFLVMAAMVTGMVGGFFRGRWVCGNLCPRGSFFETFLAKIAPRRPTPALLRSRAFRWMVFTALMGFMAFRLSANPTSIDHWGRVLWMMCALTTGVGLVTALTIHPRSWCGFCPVGTFSGTVGGKKKPLQIAASCKECRTCEKNCPMSLPIVSHKDAGALAERDCLRCSECVGNCPTGALEWPKAA